MKIIQCKRKHYYDADKFAACPHCAVSDKDAADTDRQEAVDLAKDEAAAGIESEGAGLAKAVTRIMEKRQGEN